MQNKILLIDAGHGGIDPSGRYTTAPSKQKKFVTGYHGYGWFYEGVSNRQIAAEFMAQATRAGFVCVPVYHPYKDTSLTTRTDLANQIAGSLGAESIYLSFHSNAFDGSARGWVIFHHPNSSKGKQLSEDIAEQVLPLCQDYDIPMRPAVLSQAFHVLTYTNMTAVLLENLFFDNEQDADVLMDREFCINLCSRILRAVEKFCK